MSYKSASLLALCCGAWVVAMPGNLRAASATFSVQNFSVPAGTGDKVISTFYPQLEGQGAGSAVELALDSALGGFAQQLEQIVNQKLATLNFNGLLGGMARASISASKTLPFDYASDPTIFTLSAGLGAAVNGTSFSDLASGAVVKQVTTDISNQTVPDLGAAVSASVLLGINLRPFHIPKLGVFDPSKLVLFVNFATFGTTVQDVALSYTTFGIHGQYHIIDQIAVLPGGILRWGGLSVGTGFDYSSFGVTFKTTLPTGNTTQTFTYQQNQPLNTNLAWTGNATLNGDIRVGSIPFEVMTSVQLLYILTLYAGGSFDLNFGSAAINAQGSEPVTVTLSDPTTGSSLQIAKPDAQLTLIANHGPTVADLRGFAGVQVNLFAIAIYAQGNADTDKNLALNFGLRAFW